MAAETMPKPVQTRRITVLPYYPTHSYFQRGNLFMGTPLTAVFAVHEGRFRSRSLHKCSPASDAWVPMASKARLLTLTVQIQLC